MRDDGMLGADAAAAFLGVKKQTLYVYVSRGLIRTERMPGGNARAYVREDLERLRAKGDARAGRPIAATSALHYGAPVIDSAITQIDPARGPVYRGTSAVALATRGATVDELAALLWGGPAPLPPLTEHKTGRVLAHKLVVNADTPLAALEAALFLLGRELPRFALPDERALGRTVLAVAHAVLREVHPAVARGALLQCTCALLADHELNPSTFTARVAASTGAGLAACLQAALGAFSGPRHGGACDRIEALLDEIAKPKRAIDVVKARLARGEEVPGFFGAIYAHEDPRSAPLLALPEAKKPGALVGRALIDAMVELGGPAAPGPSVDLALVVAARGAGWPTGMATAAFAVARVTGWIAHVLEQRTSEDVLRPRARFTGAITSITSSGAPT